MEDPDPLYFIYSAACSYYMGLYKDAELAAMQVGGAGTWFMGEGAGRSSHRSMGERGQGYFDLRGWMGSAQTVAATPMAARQSHRY